jgi:hypothetical protein
VQGKDFDLGGMVFDDKSFIPEEATSNNTDVLSASVQKYSQNHASKLILIDSLDCLKLIRAQENSLKRYQCTLWESLSNYQFPRRKR